MESHGTTGFRHRPYWLLPLVGLTLVQAVWSCRALAPERPLSAVRACLEDDQPIIAGRHPLHLYHARLGTANWFERASTSCFDPAFQGGYPKTPIFDAGVRPAEFALWVGGGRDAAWKIMIAALPLFIPWFFALVGRGVELSAGRSCLCAGVAVGIWWTGLVHERVAAGDIHLLLGCVAILIHQSWLIRFDREPRPDAWLVLTVAGIVGWYAHPLLWLTAVSLGFLWYAWVAQRHHFVWHFALTMTVVVPIAVNAGWLSEWFRYWWLRLPDGGESTATLSLPIFLRAESSFLKALYREHPLLPALLATGVVGWIRLWRSGDEMPAVFGLLNLAIMAFLLRALRVWQLIPDVEADQLAPLLLFAAAAPTADLCGACAERLRRLGTPRLRGILISAAILPGAFLLDRAALPSSEACRSWCRPLPIGLGEERLRFCAALADSTTADARILWEERELPPGTPLWTPFLPPLTGRCFLGGLDPEPVVEHMHCRLRDGVLIRRPIKEWQDAELENFLDRYNIGWVVACTEATRKRLARRPNTRVAIPLPPLPEGGDYALIPLGRKHSYTLIGQATIKQMDRQRIALAEVVPDAAGRVVLSLHHQTGMTVVPSHVQIERDLDPYDPIPLIRLRLPGPTARVTITWEHP